MKRSLLSIAIMSLVLAAPGIHAEGEVGSGGRRVTDPNTSAKWGFSPDTILFIAPNAEVIQRPVGLGRDELSATSAQSAPTSAAAKRGAPGPAAGNVRYLPFNAAMLRPQHGALDGSAPDLLGYFPSTNLNPPHYMQILLPPRAKLQGLRWWALNQKFAGDQESMEMAVFKQCLPAHGAGQPVITMLAVAGTAFELGDQSGFIDLSPDEVVNNAACTYTFVANYEPFWQPGDIYLERVRAQYIR